MDKKTGIIIGVLVLLFGGLAGISVLQQSKQKYNYSGYDLTQIAKPDEANGEFGDIIEGNPEAPVILVEYGDYQCTACAPMNPYINQVIEEYNGKVALVYRTMIMSYHKNGTAAASAALAAARQGYWKEYKDLLYKNQDDWYESDASLRQTQFESYFLAVSNNKGDIEQFRADMKSKEVAQKITWDDKMSSRAGVEWTPYFVVNGELVSQRNITREEFLNNLRKKLDEALKAQGIEK